MSDREPVPTAEEFRRLGADLKRAAEDASAAIQRLIEAWKAVERKYPYRPTRKVQR